MSHRNARLTVHGRLLLIDRVVGQGWAVAHAAKAMGVSRQCAHRWMSGFAAEGESGLIDPRTRVHLCLRDRRNRRVLRVGLERGRSWAPGTGDRRGLRIDAVWEAS
jgi:hypothetical protein